MTPLLTASSPPPHPRRRYAVLLLQVKCCIYTEFSPILERKLPFTEHQRPDRLPLRPGRGHHRQRPSHRGRGRRQGSHPRARAPAVTTRTRWRPVLTPQDSSRAPGSAGHAPHRASLNGDANSDGDGNEAKTKNEQKHKNHPRDIHSLRRKMLRSHQRSRRVRPSVTARPPDAPEAHQTSGGETARTRGRRSQASPSGADQPGRAQRAPRPCPRALGPARSEAGLGSERVHPAHPQHLAAIGKHWVSPPRPPGLCQGRANETQDLNQTQSLQPSHPCVLGTSNYPFRRMRKISNKMGAAPDTMQNAVRTPAGLCSARHTLRSTERSGGQGGGSPWPALRLRLSGPRSRSEWGKNCSGRLAAMSQVWQQRQPYRKVRKDQRMSPPAPRN